jgi:FkbM family methyltransferase
MDLLPHNLAEQERQVYGSQPHQSVRTGDVVMDCGANVGVFVRTALQAGAKLVVAVEPSPENLVCLRRNFEAELAQGSVVVVPKGVLDRQGTLDFAIRSDHTSNRFVLDARRWSTAGYVQLPVTTIDKLVDELSLSDVNFIKMDIEGSEQPALKGAMQTLKRFRPRLAISVYHRADDPDMIPDLVRSAGVGYQMQCGACSFDRKRFRLKPEIMFFN